MSASRVSRQATAVALTALAGVLRLVTNSLHLFNFNPIYAGGTFGGARVRGPLGFAVPFLMWIGGDFLLYVFRNFDPLYRPSFGNIWFVMSMVCMANYILLGRFFIGQSKSWSRIGAASAIGWVQFFVLSNLGSFFYDAQYAPRGMADLVRCYVNAIEFAWPSLIANLVFTPLWFAVHEAATQGEASVEPVAVETAA